MNNPSVRALNYPQWVATERLALRWPAEADARELFQRCTSDPVVARYLLWPAHTSIDQTLAFITKPITDTGIEFQSWLMRTKNPGQVVGVIGCRRIEPHIIQFGYYLAQAEWGRGYATEVTRAMVCRSGSAIPRFSACKRSATWKMNPPPASSLRRV